MADIHLSQQEAETLLQIDKVYDGNPNRDYPNPGEKLALECVSTDGADRFSIDVFRGAICLTKATHNLRVRKAIPLLRLDLDGRPHRNPDGSKVGRTHLHVYREGYGDAWAHELPVTVLDALPPFELTDYRDLAGALDYFLQYCRISSRPTFNRVLL